MSRYYKHPMITLGPLIDGVEGIETDERENAKSIAQSLGEAIEDRGYDEVYGDLTSTGTGSGKGTMLGNTGPVNFIPGEPCADCHQVVVAMATGSDKGAVTGFPQIMRELRSLLIRCAGTTKVVLLITDVWDEGLVEENRKDLLAHQDRGVLIVVLLADGKTLTYLRDPL